MGIPWFFKNPRISADFFTTTIHTIAQQFVTKVVKVTWWLIVFWSVSSPHQVFVRAKYSLMVAFCSNLSQKAKMHVFSRDFFFFLLLTTFALCCFSHCRWFIWGWQLLERITHNLTHLQSMIVYPLLKRIMAKPINFDFLLRWTFELKKVYNERISRVKLWH